MKRITFYLLLGVNFILALFGVNKKGINPKLAQLLLEKQDAILIDVRDKKEYQEQSICGAMLIPLSKFNQILPKNKNKTYLLYCRNGNRSATGSKIMKQLGYKNVYNLGGIRKWPYEKSLIRKDDYMLEQGTKAPTFKLPNQDGELVSLEQFLGKKVVLYFYPKDNTPGCTREACSFRDTYTMFKDKDVIIIGISKDTPSSHRKFIEKYNLPFILLSDVDLQVIKDYKVLQEKMMFGKLSIGVMRSTFIIDEQGMIEKVYPKANPDNNAQEILDYLNL